MTLAEMGRVVGYHKSHDYAWVEVIDQGGMWTADEFDDEHGRGLTIVAAVAGDGNWESTAMPQAARHGSGSTGTPTPRNATHL